MDEQNEQNQRPPDQPEEEPVDDMQPEPAEQPAAPPPVDTPQPEPVQPIAEEPVPPVPVPVPTPVPPPGLAAPPQGTGTLIIVGWVLVALSFLCCCCGPVFAIPAIILGVIAYSRGDQRGLWIIIAGAVALFYAGGAGMFFGANPNRVPYFNNHWPVPGRPV